MATIQVTPEMLRNKATEVRTIKSNNDQIVANITTLVTNLNSQWKGTAQDAFSSRYNTFKSTTYVSFNEMMDGYASLMDEVASKLEQTDTTLKSTVSSFT